jgi:hypothetical protein
MRIVVMILLDVIVVAVGVPGEVNVVPAVLPPHDA